MHLRTRRSHFLADDFLRVLSRISPTVEEATAVAHRDTKALELDVPPGAITLKLSRCSRVSSWIPREDSVLERLISADCHVTEPMDLWKRHLPSAMRERGPRLEVRGGRLGFVTFQRDPVGIANVERTGARCLLWGSDHPHPEGTFPESRRILAEQMQNVPTDIVQRIVWDNAVEIDGFSV
jgi:hypothetical protein